MASAALAVLAISVIASLFASINWRADLFSHFYIQYACGAAFLAIWSVFFKKNLQAALATIICIFSLYVIHTSFVISPKPELNSHETKNLSILHYNRNYGITDHAQLEEFLNSSHPDIAVIQEATPHHVKMAENLREIYPYQIHEPRLNAFGMVVLSQHPFLKAQVNPFERVALDNFQVKFSIQRKQEQPVTFYAIHPPPPTSKLLNQQRNMEIALTGEDIASDNSENIVMLGDWNITPFSPPFKQLLKRTGLKNEFSTYPLFTTWPSMFFLPIFQIPIDHVLHKGNLTLVNKKRVDAMGSDHYAVLATFSLKTEE